MKKRGMSCFCVFVTLASVVVLFAVLPDVHAAGVLVGQVVGCDIHNQLVPLGLAKVKVYAKGRIIQSVSPDFNGFYSMSLPSGIYVATAEHTGFNTQSRVVEILNGHSTRLDFYLENTTPIPQPPASFDFSLSNSGRIIVSSGESGRTAIQVALNSGSTQSVSLSVSGLPPGASASLSSPAGIPPFTSTCKIITSSSTLAGSYTVTVIGTAGVLTRSTSFTLTVTLAIPEFPHIAPVLATLITLISMFVRRTKRQVAGVCARP